ncbi:hypothetical protein IMCC3317_21550 [Kordia antarctica]|uniref:Uncharacterized protein n=1 Tax=Kordia antarctica TaxID=1218801 RepID=A0A7L4ZJI9_9FLAO|nr:hypothetical protein IMCC3317_21550 [Kordia antarctica]
MWLVALAGTKLVKENELARNPQYFPSTYKVNNGYTRYWQLGFHACLSMFFNRYI